ncbi:MAG: mRNA surveillance protein pelota [Candidatus Thermoplasmatota archaeon]|nr:mRNA surveillance protein pelota [Candidatus Thermoplasmatota archaeon]
MQTITCINVNLLHPLMRILAVDRKSQFIKVLIETPDDLWTMFNILEKEDVVSGLTYRREEQKSDMIRADRGEKKRMWLSISVDDFQFREYTDSLRLKGVIVEGPQDHGQHHSLEFCPGDSMDLVKKDWKDGLVKRLREAEKQTRRPKVLMVGLDDEEAYVASLWQYGVQKLAVIRAPGGGKRYGGEGADRRGYYGEILSSISQAMGGEDLPVVIVGPGFYKDELAAVAKEKKVAGRWITLSTGQAGMVGINEALKSTTTAKILSEHRVSLETEAVESLMGAIQSGKPSAYGIDEVKRAVDCGAADLVMALESKLRDKQVDEVLAEADRLRCRIMIISPLHDAGARLEALGGIGALLKYEM